MKGAGLLALGEFGKGLAGGMTEAIKLEIQKRRDDALFQREKTLEEYRHGKRTEEEEKKYGRRTAEEEKTYQRRREEEGTEYKGRREKEQAEYESRLTAKGKEPSEEQKKYEFYVNTFGKEEALKLIRGKSDKFTTAQLDTLKYAADLVLEGKSAEEVNAVLEAAGVEERYVEYETGEEVPVEGTGFLGLFQEKEKEKKLRLESRPKGLLGGVSDERAGSAKKGDENQHLISGKKPTPTGNTFDELISKISPDDKAAKPAKTGGLLEKKPSGTTDKAVPYPTKFIGEDPDIVKANKEEAKKEMVGLANKVGVGPEDWKATWNLYKDIAKWLWGSYDNFVGAVLESQRGAREKLGQ